MPPRTSEIAATLQAERSDQARDPVAQVAEALDRDARSLQVDPEIARRLLDAADDAAPRGGIAALRAAPG
jgi:hypothetical protein